MLSPGAHAFNFDISTADDFIEHIDQFYNETPPEQPVLIARRRTIIANLKEIIKSYSSASNQPSNTIISFIQQLLATETQDDVSIEAWNTFIEQLNSVKIANLKPNINDLNLFLLLRYQFDLAYPEEPILKNTLDATLETINKKGVFSDKDPNQLLLQLMNLLYDKRNLSVAHIQQLGSAINILIKANLFTKINFIRLLLVPIHKDKAAEFYKPVNLSSDIIFGFIKALEECKILTQYNLEVLFKVFAMYFNKGQAPSLSPLDLLTHFIDTAETLRIDHYNDKFEELVTTSQNGEYQPLTDAEKSRVIDEDYQENQVEIKLAKYLEELFTRTLNNPPAEPSYLLNQLAQQNKLPRSEMIAIVQKALPHTMPLANLISKLNKDQLLNDENLLLLFMLAENIADFSIAYSLFQEYRIYNFPQQIFESLISITPYVKAVNALFLWLPPLLRTKEYGLTILENANYADDLLAVCNFEFKVNKPRIELLEILTIKTYLAALRTIYKFIEDANLNPFKTYIEILSLVEIYLYPAIAKQLLEDNQHEAATLFHSVIANVQSQYKARFETLKQDLSDCEFVVINPGQAGLITYTHTSNAAYFFNPDLNKLYYSNKIFGSREVTLTPNQSSELFDHHKTSAKLLPTEHDAIKKTTGFIPTEISLEVIKQLEYCSLDIPRPDLTQLIQAYILLHQAKLLESFAFLLERHYKYAINLANALIQLQESHLLQFKYIALLELQPELSESIAENLITSFNHAQLNFINSLRLRSALKTQTIIAKATIVDILQGKSLTHTGHATLPSPPRITHQQTALSLLERGEDVNWDEEEEPVPSSSVPAVKRPEIDKGELEAELLSFDSEAAESVDEMDDEEEPDEQTALLPPSASSSDEDDDSTITFNALVTRCRKDFEAGTWGGFFKRSSFLDQVEADKITTMEQVINYTKANPRSRTARIYLEMSVEYMGDSRLKTFLTSYFKDYTFSFFQRSQLVPDLLNHVNKDLTMDLIDDHAEAESCCGNRTANILRRLV